MSLSVLHRRTDHRDFIYSLAAVGNLALTGGGDGSLLVHDVCSGQCLYGLGANRGAVRAAHASAQRLVCAGDDGGVVVYTFGAEGERGRRVGSDNRAEVGGGGSEAGLGGCDAPTANCARACHGRRAAGARPSSGIAPVLTVRSQAQEFAEKKRMGMERAAAIREQRQRAAAAGPGGDVGRVGPPLSELDMLHALADQKFGRGRCRG